MPNVLYATLVLYLSCKGIKKSLQGVCRAFAIYGRRRGFLHGGVLDAQLVDAVVGVVGGFRCGVDNHSPAATLAFHFARARRCKFAALERVGARASHAAKSAPAPALRKIDAKRPNEKFAGQRQMCRTIRIARINSKSPRTQALPMSLTPYWETIKTRRAAKEIPHILKARQLRRLFRQTPQQQLPAVSEKFCRNITAEPANCRISPSSPRKSNRKTARLFLPPQGSSKRFHAPRAGRERRPSPNSRIRGETAEDSA